MQGCRYDGTCGEVREVVRYRDNTPAAKKKRKQERSGE